MFKIINKLLDIIIVSVMVIFYIVLMILLATKHFALNIVNYFPCYVIQTSQFKNCIINRRTYESSNLLNLLFIFRYLEKKNISLLPNNIYF